MFKSDTLVPVRFLADYQMMGDMEGKAWAELVFSKAKEDGKILEYEVLSSLPGIWGLQFITFTVDALIPDGPYDTAKDVGETLLNEIVGDSDINVRWVSSLAESKA